MDVKRVCIIGGSGFIGRHVAASLSARAIAVTIPTRRRERSKEGLIVLPGVDVLECDVGDAAQLNALVAGHDAVVSMVGILHGTPTRFEQAHVALVDSIIAACANQGVRRLVHISALGADENGPSLYLQSKGRGEARVKASGLDWTVLRPSLVFGADDHLTTLFATLNRCLPVLPLAGAATRFQPIWVEDVARAVGAVLERDETRGGSYDLVGPDTLTLRDLARRVGRLDGGARPVLALPSALAWWQAALMECLPGPTLMSRDNLRSLSRDSVSEHGFPSRELGFEPASLTSILPLYLGHGELNARRSAYRQRLTRE
nr:complex I NDUFA9 subunit family protein [Paludibacterium yongneupense]